MKKRWIVYLIILLIIILVVGILLFNQITINQIIQKSNHCSIDNDCKLVDFGCPFGCGSYVNPKEVSKINFFVTIYDLFHPLFCEYKCNRPSIPICSNNKCIPKICEMDMIYNPRVIVGDNMYALECQCPEGSVGNINSTGLICIKRR